MKKKKNKWIKQRDKPMPLTGILFLKLVIVKRG
jgi:hypothetical protein